MNNFVNFEIYDHSYIEYSGDASVCHSNSDPEELYFISYIEAGGGKLVIESQEIDLHPNNIYFIPSACKKYEMKLNSGTRKIDIHFRCKTSEVKGLFQNTNQFQCLMDSKNFILLIKETILSKDISKQIMLKSLVLLSIAPLIYQKHIELKV